MIEERCGWPWADSAVFGWGESRAERQAAGYFSNVGGVVWSVPFKELERIARLKLSRKKVEYLESG